MNSSSESADDAFKLPVVRLSASGKLRGREFHFSPQQRKATGAELSHVFARSREADDEALWDSLPETPSLPGVSASREPDTCSAPVIPVKLEAKADESELEESSEKAKVSRRFQRTGVWEFKPFVYTEDLEPTPDWDRSIVSVADDSTTPEASPAMSPNVPKYVPYGFADTSRRGLWLTLGVGTMLVVIAEGAGVYVWFRDAKPVAEGPVANLTDLSARANESAKVALSGFLAAKDASSLAERVIDGEKKLPAIERYLKENGSFPKPGELDEISSLPLSAEDSKRGIAGLIYQRDPSVDLLPTNSLSLLPLASRKAGSIDPMAMVSMSQGKKPRQALALFKRKDDRMLLDWDLFVQTWDRSLAAFRDGELGNGPMRFRVLVASDIPVFENGETMESAVFRMQDPLYVEDVVRVQTKCFSPEERKLLEFNRTSSGTSARVGQTRTATLDLVRDPESGRVGISRFVCWEFLGIGGKEQPHESEE